jgi:rubrerythrin
MSAVTDLQYDILTMLQSKLEALAAYDIFLDDAEAESSDECRQLIREIQADDERHADRLRDELKKTL